jgi:hypothetical protein
VLSVGAVSGQLTGGPRGVGWAESCPSRSAIGRAWESWPTAERARGDTVLPPGRPVRPRLFLWDRESELLDVSRCCSEGR